MITKLEVWCARLRARLFVKMGGTLVCLTFLKLIFCSEGEGRQTNVKSAVRRLQFKNVGRTGLGEEVTIEQRFRLSALTMRMDIF